ncbi:GNAT family N-acetyltransferase [Shinella sp.]
MIAFRRMSRGEFLGYRNYFIPDYAAEISTNYGVSMPDGLRRAEQEIDRDLPSGPETQGQVLLCILQDGYPDEIIGYVWYCPDDEHRSVFISDFCMLPEHRGKGDGQRALAALEAMLRARGYNTIKLRVAADNARAQHVYRTSGFRATGINMAKQIGDGGGTE